MSGVSILVTTIDKEEKARALARAALAERLAACVQITRITSHYAWKGEYCEETEFRLEMKCRAEDYPALAALTRRLHSYETPELLRIDAAEVDPDYRAWLVDATRQD
ncbi:divalent-cation tolerance protein CutA [Methylocystis sp. JAN1]|uniref:divalent-cation tolerance protein CutA n=1 Tax=Methylocystis sp. JAN1 TaxID=3397211 RepID=UPI003FA26882